MAEKHKRPYGLWPSDLTPEVMAQSLRLQDVQWDTDGETLVWLEGRSDRGVLVASTRGEAPRDLTEQHHVRAGVGYGGGDFTVAHGRVYFAEKQSGRLFSQSLAGGAPQPVTPAFGRAASPQLDPQGEWLLFVHSDEDNDVIAIVDAEGRNWPRKLEEGSDFYMQVTWHPSGEQIAWVEWDHPNMPWDGTRLKWARLNNDRMEIDEILMVEGDEHTSIFQPEFSPDGATLSYLTTHNDLDALMLFDLRTRERRVLLEGAVLRSPAWAQGMRTYGWSHDSKTLWVRRNDRGFASLCSVDVASGQSASHSIEGRPWLEQLAVHPSQPRVAMLASAPTVPPRVCSWSEDGLTVHRRSSGENVPAESLPQPEAVSWKADDGTDIHGLYYPPTHSRFASDGLPPAIVNIHGGPTVQRVASYNSDAAFFTSRGFAYLEVNYRGSTGYGKAYLDMLKGQWGVYDVEDAASAAHFLQSQQRADGSRLVIKGGSAGGYTVLNALVHHPGVFRAGICLFGISNLFTLVADTHKFEARYVDSLIGPLPEASALYRERSPLFHAANIQDPIAIFQGSEDRVVPPNQAEAIVAALRARGVPHRYELFEGEGHGWRKSETIQEYYTKVMEFLQEQVLFS